MDLITVLYTYNYIYISVAERDIKARGHLN